MEVAKLKTIKIKDYLLRAWEYRLTFLYEKKYKYLF